MKNAIQKSWQAFLPVFFLLTLAAPARSGYCNNSPVPLTCPAPEASITNRTSSSISFSWNPATGVTGYKVWYHRSEDNYTSTEISTGGTSFTYPSLPPGTYTFYICSVCSGQNSTAYILEDLLMG